MSYLDNLGLPRSSYEGRGDLAFGGFEPIPVHFEARQLPDASMIVECNTEGSMNQQDFLMGFWVSRHGREVAFSGTSGEGRLVVEGFVHNLGQENDAQIVRFEPQTLVVTFEGVEQGESGDVEVPLINLAFVDSDLPESAPSALPPAMSFKGYDVTIRTTEQYLPALPRMVKTGGYTETARVVVHGGARLPREELESLLWEVAYPLALATGNKVGYPFYEVYNDRHELLRRVHRDSIIHPFSNRAKGLGLTARWAELIAAWDTDHAKRRLTKREIQRRIDQYVDCCDRHLYMDSQTILACVLLDSLTKHYYGTTHSNTKTEHTNFEDRLRHTLTELGLDDSVASNVVQTRRRLVHEGRFASQSTKGEAKLKECSQSLWAAFAILVKLVNPNAAVEAFYDPTQQGFGDENEDAGEGEEGASE